MSELVCIFDCETIPDVELCKKEFHLQGDDALQISNEAFAKQLEKSNSSFLPLPFHQVVAISAVIADSFGNFQRVNTIAGESERDFISGFLKFIDTHNPKLISFNGRAFDMPMLLIRAMRYNLSCEAFFEKDNSHFGKSKWDNYRYRYSDRFHVDLMDHIGEFGAARGLNLNTLCAMVNLPGKFDTKGDQVVALYYQDAHQKINEYCESDTLNTYWLYLKYELLKGNLTLADYLQILENFYEKLPKDKNYSEIFGDFIQKEIKNYS
jgi:predicted PolB exonuclease-like 3'-5' exonuclease